MRIVGVNGINTHGEGSIDLLLARLKGRGFDVVDVRLPKRHALSARWGGCSDGNTIAQEARDGDIVVAHSFGCLRAHYAHQVRDFAAVVCIAPAMSDAALWRDPARVHCFYSRRDLAVRIGSRLLLHPFGSAGTQGFDQKGVTNIRADAGHSDYFRGYLLTYVADYVERLARAAAQAPLSAA